MLKRSALDQKEGIKNVCLEAVFYSDSILVTKSPLPLFQIEKIFMTQSVSLCVSAEQMKL